MKSGNKEVYVIAVLVTLASIKYLQIIFYSEERWFHVALIAMAAFGAIQAR